MYIHAPKSLSASPSDIVNWIIDYFNSDGRVSAKLDKITEQVLLRQGFGFNQASLEVEAKLNQVRHLLQRKYTEQPETLPFEFSHSDPYRLVGKLRLRNDEPAEVSRARRLREIVPDVAQGVYALGDGRFESLCANLMRLSGATDAYAQRSSDDGGVDVYGRIPLRAESAQISNSILHTSLLNRPFLFIGQCKCYKPHERIGRPDIISFHGHASRCLEQYRGNAHPPTHRVPEAYYRVQETCLKIFFSTAGYSGDAVNEAHATDIILVNGTQIAEFLLHNKIAVVETDESVFRYDSMALESWVDSYNSPST